MGTENGLSPLQVLLNQALFTPVEVAAILRCDPQTVYNKIKSGDLLATKDGGRWKITRKTLIEYLETHYGISS